jgi:hypothetical protein
MSNLITSTTISTNIPLRQVLSEDFKLDLPVEGGWGYNREDSIIVKKPTGPIPFDLVGLEYVIVEKRIYEELIIFRGKGNGFADIKWDLIKQNIITDNKRRLDHLIFKVSAHKESDFESLKQEFGKGFGTPGFDLAAHTKKHRHLQWSYETEFWFDISDV